MAIATKVINMYLLTQGFSEAESFDTCCRLLVHRLNWGMRITGAAIAELSSDVVINELGRFGLQAHQRNT